MNRQRVFFALLPFLLGSIALGMGCGSTTEDEHVFDDPDTYAKYGKQALQKEKPNLDQAIRYYQDALELDPEHFDSLIGLGDALMYRALSMYQQNLKNQANADENQNQPGNKQDQTPYDPQKISETMRQAWKSYQTARKLRPESPVPYYKLGRFYYEFKTRGPNDLPKGITYLKKALNKVNNQENQKKKPPAIKGKILYYLGYSIYYNQHRKSSEKRNFTDVQNYLHKYLRFYSSRDVKPPDEGSVEKLLMRLEEDSTQTNESGSNPASRDAGSNSNS